MDTSKITSRTFSNLDEVVRVIRNPPPRTAGGITIPKKVTCFCNRRVPMSEFLVIPNTGVVSNVASTICRNCPNKARETVAGLAAVVCARCREVVLFMEPFRERRSGFEWKAGRCYHTPNCPTCVGKVFARSPVLEQKLFYKEKGIPYPEDDSPM